MAPPRIVFAKDLAATIGKGMTSSAAARKLGVTERTIRRCAAKFAIPLKPRDVRIKGQLEWQRVYDQHGPSVRRIAAAISMNRNYIALQLQRHGIISEYDAWAIAEARRNAEQVERNAAIYLISTLGESHRKIAAALGVPKWSVWKHARKNVA